MKQTCIRLSIRAATVWRGASKDGQASIQDAHVPAGWGLNPPSLSLPVLGCRCLHSSLQWGIAGSLSTPGTVWRTLLMPSSCSLTPGEKNYVKHPMTESVRNQRDWPLCRWWCTSGHQSMRSQHQQETPGTTCLQSVSKQAHQPGGWDLLSQNKPSPDSWWPFLLFLIKRVPRATVLVAGC